MQGNKNSGVGILIFGGFVLLIILIGLFKRESKPATDTAPARPAGMSDAEYNYVNGRMRQEGASAKEADEATRAIWQFEQARRAREGK